ncbi:ATP-dependent Clp protease proteolytic subunit [Methylobacterium sp. 174MFSha1.1]|uniref:SDH family Clp fold serine proteinase n=1 Tax=Methylobacterium sp. 174MFSha1.1 TaxID=1502749 RepID=UPI000B896D4D|nr:ATP-dependent Clp protease proteolytic subunit [Methylobacterium sp. 174MFSha1.1]
MITDQDGHISSNSFIETELCTKIKNIGDHTASDVVSLIAPMQHGIDDLMRDSIEEIKNKKPKVIVILETDGGSIEVVERIADLLRYHYPQEVSFLIPSHAMSAGTVLAMSGDNIYMDYFSILGPIDPQVVSRSKGDVYVPALGYLQKYEDLLSKSKITQLQM